MEKTDDSPGRQQILLEIHGRFVSITILPKASHAAQTRQAHPKRNGRLCSLYIKAEISK
jgi:hypothetical protein